MMLQLIRRYLLLCTVFILILQTSSLPDGVLSQKPSTTSIKEKADTSLFINRKPKAVFPYRNNSTNLAQRGFWLIDPSLAFLGIASLGSISLLSLPFFIPKIKQRLSHTMNSRQNFHGAISDAMAGVSESLMSWVEKHVRDMPHIPKLDAQECLKRSICEAHSQPKKYGLMGFFLQLLFPPYTETDEPYKVISSYQLAARYGRQSHTNCSLQYGEGCMVNILDVLQTLGNMIII